MGLLGFYFVYRYKKGGFEQIAQEILHHTESEASRRRAEFDIQLKQKEFDHRQSLERVSEQKMQKLALREEKLDRQLTDIEKKMQGCDKREKELARMKEESIQKESELESLKMENLIQLESLAGISSTDAKNMLVKQFSKDIETECGAILTRQKKEIEEDAEKHAIAIITTAIHRLTLPTVSEVAVITVALPNHEMKGRVIGREGRNIRILEQATGVNFVIDDTPNAVLISGFDPIRKEIARIALKELIQDGRIHPTRIEEVVAKAEEKVHTKIKSYGEEAAMQAGSLSLHTELINLLGKLHFLYSYGQNMLAHSLEVSYLMGIIAAELRLDSERARRMGLLHDIGKALSHEMEGSHALIGQQIALKYGECEEVANGIGCHHDEVQPLTIEASLISAANKMSAERPGARSEALEHSIKRSLKLEQISYQFEGVEKAYAMYTGKEIRVIIEPDKFDDSATVQLAREIAKKIEKELSYPGKIKVTVIREKRAVEYAS